MIDALLQPYSFAKVGWSWINNLIKPAPRAELPRFAHPKDAGEWIFKNVKYTGDKAGGWLDGYTDPKRIMAAVLNPALWPDTPCDCDDFAVFAVNVCEVMPDTSAGIFTIVGTNPALIHVVAAGWHKGQAWAIDTSGYRPLPDLNEATLIKEWTKIYAAQNPGYFAARWVAVPRF